MDVESRERWVEYSRAKDVMLEHIDRKLTLWHIVDADSKKKARLNCIAHLLRQVPYQDMRPVQLEYRRGSPTAATCGRENPANTGFRRDIENDRRRAAQVL
jgi:hypothetical protein